MIDSAARVLGAESRPVLALRRRRAFSRRLAGDHRSASPEFEALADACGRVSEPNSEETPAGLNGVLEAVRTVDGDVSENVTDTPGLLPRELADRPSVLGRVPPAMRSRHHRRRRSTML
ncbi:hypothetical protein [Streptomyces sp. NPDC055186]